MAGIFGRRLRLIRKSQGLTLEALGRLAGIGYKHIADVERGEKAPSFEAVGKLASALRVPPHELFLVEADEKNVSRSLRQLVHEISQQSSPAIKQLAVEALVLIRRHEIEANVSKK